MLQFSANLTLMFAEYDFIDRFDAAAGAGFNAVECLFPYELSIDVLAKKLYRNNLSLALFNMPPGDWRNGERGLAALPERYEDFCAGVEKALEYAEATATKNLHMMAGLADPKNPQALAAYRRARNYAAEKAGDAGVVLLLEPINPRSMPGYFLNDFGLAERLVGEAVNVKLQFDAFHRQIMCGDIAMALRRLMPIIGHIQIASVPSRHEPDGEEINFPYLFSELERLNYTGYIGCEYNPRTTTEAGLTWFKPYCPTKKTP